MKMICEPTRHWYLATPQQGLLFKTIRIEGMRCGLEGCRGRSGRFRACMFQNATARRSSEETGSLTSPDCLGKVPSFASTAILMVSRCKTRRSKSFIKKGGEMAEEVKENGCLFCTTKQGGIHCHLRAPKDNSQRKPCQAPSVSIWKKSFQKVWWTFSCLTNRDMEAFF